MAAGKKIENENEARRCLIAARREGLSAGKWGRAHGIDGRSLHAWKVNLERRSAPVRRPRRARAAKARALVELVAAPSSVAVGGNGRYVLEVAGARLEFGDDVSAVTLRRVLEVLRTC